MTQILLVLIICILSGLLLGVFLYSEAYNLSKQDAKLLNDLITDFKKLYQKCEELEEKIERLKKHE